MILRFLAIGLLAASLALEASHAQSAFERRGDSLIFVYALETIVVRGEHQSSPPMQIELSTDEIAKRNTPTVADLLRFETGLSVSTGPKAETETRIRGFNARDVLVLVDGRPINPGYYGKVDLSMLPVDNIAAVKVIKGPSSVAYGANGMGGVINVVTKNGLEKPRTVIESEFGDHLYRKLNINHSRRLGGLNYWVSVYNHFSDGYALSDDFVPNVRENGGYRDNSFYSQTGVTGKLGYQPDDNSLYSLSAGYHWAEKAIPSTTYTGESARYREFPKWIRFNSSLAALWHPSQSTELTATVFADAQHDRFIDYSGIEKLPEQISFDSKLENWTIGGCIAASIHPSHRHRIRVGLNFKRDLMNKKPDVNEAWVSHHISTGSIFLEDEFTPFKSTEVTVGLAYHLSTTDTDRSSVRHTSPMVSLVQSLPLRLHLRLAWANAIRFPAMHYLYSNSSGNPDLLPEEANKFELGLSRRFDFDEQRYASVELAFFHNDLNNVIYRASRSYRYENIGNGDLRGIEIAAEVSISENLSAQISYSHLASLESSTEMLEEVAPNKWRLLVDARIWFGLKVAYEYGWLDARTTYLTESQGFMLPEYGLHRLNLSFPASDFLTLRLTINNITDVYSEDELGYPGPGRQITGGLNLTL